MVARMTLWSGLIGATIVALGVGALAFGAATAAAASPVICVRNLSVVSIDVVAGVDTASPQKPGLYLGVAKARSVACREASVGGETNVSFRRVASHPRSGRHGDVVSTAEGGWKACPAQASADGRYVYTVTRRGILGLSCVAGGGDQGLQTAGGFE